VVFVSLENVAAQGDLLSQDDPSVRLVALCKEPQPMRVDALAQGLSRAKERTGMFPTAVVGRAGERLLCLDYAGRAHAGEPLAALVEQREADLGPPGAMSAAWARNEGEAGLVRRCHCLAHGRRQCSDLAEVLPSACRVVIAALNQVFDHEAEARAQRLSAEARVAYPQAYGPPLRDDRKAWTRSVRIAWGHPRVPWARRSPIGKTPGKR
jgi:hypothetical protein